MRQKTLHPSAALSDRAGRARGWKSFADAPTHRFSAPSEREQGAAPGPMAWAHIFVSRLGKVGYWLPACPFCGCEHVHGGYEPFDPRKRQGFAKFQTNLRGEQSLGWRGPHCHEGPQHDISADDGREYELMLAAGPARFAPGAARSRLANRTMRFLRSLGIETSHETIPSAWPLPWWRWR
jgi:hypothetical protein